jgi:hypothetical protein
MKEFRGRIVDGRNIIKAPGYSPGAFSFHKGDGRQMEEVR